MTQDTTTQQPPVYTSDPSLVLAEIAQELRRLNDNIAHLMHQNCSADQPRFAVQVDLSADAVEKLGHLLRRT